MNRTAEAVCTRCCRILLGLPALAVALLTPGPAEAQEPCTGLAPAELLAPNATAAREPCTVLELVSVDSAGNQGNWLSFIGGLSGDGRFVVFVSLASNFVSDDPSYAFHGQVFVFDRDTGQLELASVAPNGKPGNDGAWWPEISQDGRYVVFESTSSNLVAGDTNGKQDVFVRDRLTERIERVSITDVEGAQANKSSYSPRISADGRFITFTSFATNLVPNDTNGNCDVFVRDRATARTERISVTDVEGVLGIPSCDHGLDISSDGRFIAFASFVKHIQSEDVFPATSVLVHDRLMRTTEVLSLGPGGIEANGASYDPALSADGRFVAFVSEASNLVAGDTNGIWDVFVHDRWTHTTEQINVSSTGEQANNFSGETALSGDGRFVAFVSRADNIVPDDANHGDDVFIHDRVMGSTRRVNRAADGTEEMTPIWTMLIGRLSHDGRFAGFHSSATNLIPDDSNYEINDVFVADNCLVTECGLQVVRPQSGEEWERGEMVTMYWAGAVPSGADVAVDLYRGPTWVARIAEPMPNVGVAHWTVPLALALADDYEVVLEAVDGTCAAASDTPFSIVEKPCTVQVVSPNGGESLERGETVPITWTGRLLEPAVTVRLLDGAGNATVLGEAPATAGRFEWAIPPDHALGDTYRVSVGDAADTCVDASDRPFSIIENSCTLRVTSPRAGDTLEFRSSVKSTWEGAAPGQFVQVRLHKGPGVWKVLAREMLNTGSLDWGVGGEFPQGDDYYLSVGSLDGSCEAVSGVFSIGGDGCALSLTAPHAGEFIERGTESLTVVWYGAPPTGTIDIRLWKGGVLDAFLASVPASSTANVGSYRWPVPADYPLGDDYTVTVDTSDGGCRVASDRPFSIVEEDCPLQITGPQHGQTFERGQSVPITWTGIGEGSEVHVGIRMRDGGVVWYAILPTNAGRYDWTVPWNVPSGDGYRVVLRYHDSCLTESETTFSVVEVSSVSWVLYPNGGEQLIRGEPADITWTRSSALGSAVHIDLYRKRKRIRAIARSVPNSGSYSWTVPADLRPGGNYRIRVRSAANRAARDFSDNPFSVVRPDCTLAVTRPNGGEQLQRGQEATVTWSGAVPGDEVHILLFRGKKRVRVLGRNVPNTGDFAWTVPTDLRPANNYRIVIRSAYDKTCRDASDATFSIVPGG